MEEAAKVAIDGFKGKSLTLTSLDSDSQGLIRREIFEDFHYIGLFDLTQVSDRYLLPSLIIIVPSTPFKIATSLSPV